MNDWEKRLKTWKELQEYEIESYRRAFAEKGSYYGFFSVDERGDARRVGGRIESLCKDCLDIGSGILPRPVYMSPRVKFFGLDPFFGEYKREFPFAQAIGEHLPFPDESFQCASFMSTLDHQIEPIISLLEVHRILRNDGMLFIWNDIWRDFSAAYKRWRSSPPGTKFNANHQHAFTIRDIEVLLSKTGFELLEMKGINKACLFIGRKK